LLKRGDRRGKRESKNQKKKRGAFLYQRGIRPTVTCLAAEETLFIREKSGNEGGEKERTGGGGGVGWVGGGVGGGVVGGGGGGGGGGGWGGGFCYVSSAGLMRVSGSSLPKVLPGVGEGRNTRRGEGAF